MIGVLLFLLSLSAPSNAGNCQVRFYRDVAEDVHQEYNHQLAFNSDDAGQVLIPNLADIPTNTENEGPLVLIPSTWDDRKRETTFNDIDAGGSVVVKRRLHDARIKLKSEMWGLVKDTLHFGLLPYPQLMP